MDNPSPWILVVDDDVDCLELARLALEAAGFRVECCESPQQATRSLAGSLPCLIITDVMMGSLDAGFSFALSIKRDPGLRDIPILIVTAMASQHGFDFTPQGSDDLRAMGADGFLSKPIMPEGLVAKVREMIG